MYVCIGGDFYHYLSIAWSMKNRLRACLTLRVIKVPVVVIKWHNLSSLRNAVVKWGSSLMRGSQDMSWGFFIWFHNLWCNCIIWNRKDSHSSKLMNPILHNYLWFFSDGSLLWRTSSESLASPGIKNVISYIRHEVNEMYIQNDCSTWHWSEPET